MITLLTCKFGSHLYGTDTPVSDLDIKEIYLPSGREIVLGTYRHVVEGRNKTKFERNNADDVDVERFSLDRFLSDLIAGQTWALDLLFAYGNLRTECPTEIGDEIMGVLLASRHRLLSKNVNAFVGYAKKQAARYGIKGSRMDAVRQTMVLLEALPPNDRIADHVIPLGALIAHCEDLVSMENTPLIEVIYIEGPSSEPVPHLHVCGRKFPLNGRVKQAREVYGRILSEYGERSRKAHLEGGVDWKALSHAVRVNGEACELLSSGWITFPRPGRELLREIKLGQWPAEEVYGMIEEGLVDLLAANEESELREIPDRAWVDEFVYETYKEVILDER